MINKIKSVMSKEFITTDKWLKIVENSNDENTLNFIEECMYESKYARDDWLGDDCNEVLDSIHKQRTDLWFKGEFK